MHLTVCFEASRLTLTQSSWTTPRPGCSRQWMSGYAALALVAPRDRGSFTNLNLTTLGEPVPPSEGESPFPLDFYLSWMSPVSRPLFPQGLKGLGRQHFNRLLYHARVNHDPETQG